MLVDNARKPVAAELSAWIAMKTPQKLVDYVIT
jgi:hypothetical protein